MLLSAFGLRAGAAILLLPALPCSALAATPPAASPGSEPSRAAQTGQPLQAPGGWSQGSTLIVTQRQSGETVLLRPGETLLVVLSANAGTGYVWDLERFDPRRITPLGAEVRPAPGRPQADGSAMPMPGAPQQITFRFRALRPGSSELSLKLWRRWEGEGSIVERFRLRLTTVGP